MGLSIRANQIQTVTTTQVGYWRNYLCTPETQQVFIGHQLATEPLFNVTSNSLGGLTTANG